MKKIIFLILISSSVMGQKFTTQEIARWQQQSKGITIIRDNWGIPHITGKADADAVFGLLYSQCEDDFERVERNYLVATARLAEAEGETFIYNDLRMRLLLDTTKAIALYKTSPEWMKKICNGFADGINYYLYTHPEVKPKLLKRFQPWMPLLFSEGSIGGDVESISLNELKKFYGKEPGDLLEELHDDGNEPEPRGSNGFAIAPSKSATGNSLLLINPHTSFYFRSEVHVKSDEGLNAYGAVTWGQFFIYQGFNEHCGWMHTSSAADVIDMYKESVVKKGTSVFYKYGKEVKPLTPEKIIITYSNGKGKTQKTFTVYRTVHGPVIGEKDGKWISVKMMNDPINALTQSYQRTKSASLADFQETMDLRTNSSNNTVYADDKGNIGYWHGDFMPKRDIQFDWSSYLDGSNPATEWKGLHNVNDIIHVINPASGWIQNCNATPFTVSGESSPNKKDYPSYMAPDFENARGLHAVKVLKDEKDFTLDKLITVSNDPYLIGFEKLLPSFLEAYDDLAAKSDTVSNKYAEPISMLRNWDLKYSVSSIPTTLAISWASRLRTDVSGKIPPGIDQLGMINFLITGTSSTEKMKAFAGSIISLNKDFGTWKVAWGDLNRFQRITGKIESIFDDNKPSLAVPFASSLWGSLASFGARKYPGTKKMYGSSGNSFVAVVEFGKRVKAKTVVTGGSSSDPASPHFNDQSLMYTTAKFKDVLFYPEDIQAHVERTYHPGDK